MQSSPVCLPSDQPPVLLYPSRESNLLANLGTRRRGKRKTCSIRLDRDDLGSGGRASNIDHQHFVLAQLGYLGLFAVCCLDTEETSEKEVVDLELLVDGRKMSSKTQHEADQTIGSAESRVYPSTDT